MDWLQIGLIGSIVFAVYQVQQIKMELKTRGYEVEVFTQWFADYRKFKNLLVNETDEKLQIKYQGILNALHMALAGAVVIVVLLVSQ